jgi:hypothetical protein
MNPDLITERTTEMSPRFQARLAAAIAWITTTSAFAIFVRAKLVVSVDAAATAHNILTHELLYRLGFLRRCSRPAVYPLYASAIQLI